MKCQQDSSSGNSTAVVGRIEGSSSRTLTPGERFNESGLPEPPVSSESALGSRRNLVLEMPSAPVEELMPIQLSQHSPKLPVEKGTEHFSTLGPALVFSSPPSSQIAISKKKKVGFKALSPTISPTVPF